MAGDGPYIRPPQDRGEVLSCMGSVHSALHMLDAVGQQTGQDRSALSAVVAERAGGVVTKIQIHYILDLAWLHRV